MRDTTRSNGDLLSKVGMRVSVKGVRRPFAMALFTALALLCAALPSTSAFAEYGDPSARVARLGYLEGNVSIQPTGVDQWSQAEPNYSVTTGDRVYTDQDGRAELSLGGTNVRMWHTTDLTMTNLSDQITQLGLAQGTIRVRTFTLAGYEGQQAAEQVEIDTPNGAITVLQPGDIRVDSYEEGTQVTVNSGQVQLSGPNLSQAIGAGASVRLTGTNPIQMDETATPGLDEFDNWSISRDRHQQQSRSAEYVSRDTPGYDDLDDYGSWDAESEYGPIWYPSQVDADWAPYRTGHWVWTGPYGWTWVESEPWGYAPFHYGRWVHYRSRWGWVPGPVRVRPVWSPALVVFAGGDGFAIGGGGLTAWFPLGVGEPYLPWYHCSSDYVRRVNVTNINIVNIHNTTIVNNYNNFVRTTNNFTNVSNIRTMNYTYLNRNAGFSAVNARAFATGQPVRNNLARVTTQQIQSAQPIAHPSIQPTRQSVVVRPVSHTVPVPVVRPTLLTQGGRQAQAVPGAHPVAVPYRPQAPGAIGRPTVTQGTRPVYEQPRPGMQNSPVAARPTYPGQPNGGQQNPVQQSPAPQNPGQLNAGRINPGQPVNGAHPIAPITPVGRPAEPGPVTRPITPPAGQPGGGTYVHPGQPPAGYTPRPLVIRNEPPAPQPTFQQQQRGFGHDPGRPLEPQQRDNLSVGRPAGRPQDQEVFPHQQQLPQQRSVQQVTRPAPVQQSRPAPMEQSRPMPMPQPHPAPIQQQPRPAPIQQSRPAPVEQTRPTAPQVSRPAALKSTDTTRAAATCERAASVFADLFVTGQRPPEAQESRSICRG